MTAAATAAEPWEVANQRHLARALDGVRAALARYAARRGGAAGPDAPRVPEVPDAADADVPNDARGAAPRAPGADGAALDDPTLDDPPLGDAPMALDRLCAAFGLSAFERDVLLLCAGAELDARFAPLCASAHGDARRAHPTFALALAALPGAHWSALTPAAPLRRWHLIDADARESLTAGALRADERVLHYLAGVTYLDERLAALAAPVPDPAPGVPGVPGVPGAHDAAALPPSHVAAAAAAVDALTRGTVDGMPTLVELRGPAAADQRAVAAAACRALGRRLYAMPAEALPGGAHEAATLARLWERESVLSGCALLVDCSALDAGDAARAAAAARLIQTTSAPLFVTGLARRPEGERPAVAVDVEVPNEAEQRDLWRRALGPAGAAALNGELDQIVSQFRLGAADIRAAGAAAAHATSRGRAPGDPPAPAGRAAWEACRARTRPRLDELAQRIAGSASWDDLVLPEAQRQILREVAAHVRHRATVYERWGFGRPGARGLGISALFAGPSGTGKTMAAEVLAAELGLDLYRVDLSATVSKYIGETEKNLRRIFDAAEGGGAVLLFDEADALFGKRSEVKDSHDRHANVEVSYLLQRMECYRGLAVLTTNMRQALDTAFLRRIRFVVQFPFPDAAQRAEIWRRAWPAGVPAEGLDAGRLARLGVAGGNIRNIALGAAFLAADAGQAVGMGHVLRAARAEYAKLDRVLTDGEVAGWT